MAYSPTTPSQGTLQSPEDSSDSGKFSCMVLHVGVNAASVAEAALLMILMLARRLPEQLQTFAQRGLGHPFGMQLLGKTLGIVGMGATGAPPCLQLSAWIDQDMMPCACCFCALTWFFNLLLGRAVIACWL